LVDEAKFVGAPRGGQKIHIVRPFIGSEKRRAVRIKESHTGIAIRWLIPSKDEICGHADPSREEVLTASV
jgi:hypothetical protein